MPFKKGRSSKFAPCKCKLLPDEDAVQPGLALTPSQIGELTRAGVPLSPVNAMQFFDGTRSLDFTPGLLNRRGVDMIDAWEAQKSTRKKLAELAKSAPKSKEGSE